MLELLTAAEPVATKSVRPPVQIASSSARAYLDRPPDARLLLEAALSLDAAELEHLVDRAPLRGVPLRELLG
jgi:hypothetical protein